MEFKDYFSTQAKIYARARPKYPDELFRFLSSLTKEYDLAWDCATGNGQAAIPLTRYFKKVIATDASEQQIKMATPHRQVKYYVALADDSRIENSTVDLVTIATALHWMDFDKFYKEIDRVLKPQGIFAAWNYCDSMVNDSVDSIVQYISKDILGDYWPDESKHVRNQYKDIPIPFKALEAPEFETSIFANLDFLIGNLYSWSATQRYIKATGKDPVELVKKQLAEAWGKPDETKEIKWKIFMKVSRKE